MIKRINVLKGVGRFSALNPTRGTEGDFSNLNVIYASNACGKSTLCDVFRSLDAGNPAYVIGQKRLGSDTQPEIVISLEGGQTTRFQDAQWHERDNCPPIHVYDDRFVAENVFIGHHISVDQRRNLYGRSRRQCTIERNVGLEHIDLENLHIRRWNSIADGTSFTRIFVPGQTLFGKRRAYQHKVAYAAFEGICSGDILTFEPKNRKGLLPELLPFISQSDAFFDHALDTLAGSLLPRISWKALKDFEFPLPPLDEQKRIAEILWTADEAVTRFASLKDEAERTRRATLFELIKKGSGEDFLRYRLQDGDILLNEVQSRELVGRFAMFQGQVDDCCFQNTLIRFRCDDKHCRTDGSRHALRRRDFEYGC